MKKKLFAALTAALMLGGTMAAPVSALDSQIYTISERELAERVCSELGIPDYDEYVAELADRFACSDKHAMLRDNTPYDGFVDIYTGGNSNGRIDAADANYLLQFLNGMINYPYVYTDLDPTGDNIIDYSDAEALMECYINVVVLNLYPGYTPSIHGNTNTTYLSESRLYYKYNAQTGIYTGQYTLYSPITSSTSMSNCNFNLDNTRVIQHTNHNRTVIDTDDRQLDYSMPGTVKIMAKLNGEYYWASGCIIDDHTILTAAHLLYTHNKGAKAIKQLRIYDANGAQIHPDGGGDFTPVESHVPALYVTGQEKREGLDYGLITVNEDLSSYTQFKLGFGLNELISMNNPIATVRVTGFPDVVNNIVVNNADLSGPNMLNACYSGTGNLSSSVIPDEYERLFAHTCDVTGGDSGAPLHLNSSGVFETLIGIHITSGPYMNFATRINVDILHFCLNNPYALH